MSPVLSIAVPTHNRARYALPAIRALLALAEPEMEVVVSDTSSDGELAAGLLAQGLLGDARLRYEKPARPLDMTGNHNAALERCTGEYVCLIGDDDGISPELPQAARWAARHRLPMLVPNVVASYVWPDFRSRHFGAAHAGRLYFSRQIKAEVQWVDSELALQAALQSAAQGTDGLPKLYHGLVRRELLLALRERTGQFVHGSSPDMSAAIGLTQVCPRFPTIDYPLTVPGASGGSNTGRSAMNRHKGRMGNDSQTKAFVTAGWSPGVPRFFSVETVWAHAALDTLKRLTPDRLADFDYARLIAACRLRHPEYGDEIAQAEAQARQLLVLEPRSWQRRLSNSIWQLRLERLAALFRRLRHPTVAGGRPFVPELDDIEQVADPLMEQLQARGLGWALMQRRLEAALA